ncbi:MAG TPA: DUF2442 domain-containing protein [Gemmatimonadales bacterium]|jgi:hypothetical protein|nr:DUF2442 domain-containing protein [Gemmatimonadales bacterium]
MFLHVVEARYLHDHTVWVRFNDGTAGEIDLSSELEGPVFGPLKDTCQFKRFEIAHHTLSWENGADFAPEFLRQHVRATPGFLPE